MNENGDKIKMMTGTILEMIGLFSIWFCGFGLLFWLVWITISIHTLDKEVFKNND